MSDVWITDIPERWLTLRNRPEIMYGLNLSKDESQYKFFMIKNLSEVYVNDGNYEYLNNIAHSKNIFLQNKAQFINICKLLQQSLCENRVSLEENNGDSRSIKKYIFRMDCMKDGCAVLDWNFELSFYDKGQKILRDIMFQQFTITDKLNKELTVLLKVINLKDNIIARFLEDKNYLPLNLQNYIQKYKNLNKNTNMLNKFNFENDILPFVGSSNINASSIWDIISDLTMNHENIWKKSNIYNQANDRKIQRVYNHNKNLPESEFDSTTSFSDLNDDSEVNTENLNADENAFPQIRTKDADSVIHKFHGDISDVSKDDTPKDKIIPDSQNTPKKKRTILGNSPVKKKKIKSKAL